MPEATVSGTLPDAIRTVSTKAQQRERLSKLLASFHHARTVEARFDRESVAEALELALLLDDREAEAWSRRQLGLCELAARNYTSAVVHLRQAHHLFEDIDDPLQEAGVMLAIGRAQAGMGDRSRAVESYHKALERQHGLMNIDGMSLAHTALGNLFADVGDYATALDHHFQALRLRENEEDRDALGVVYSDIGFVYAQMEELDRARDFFTRSLDLFIASGNQYLQARALGNIGAIHLSQGDLDTALDYGLRTLVMQEQLGLTPELAEALIAVASIYLRADQMRETWEYYDRALTIGAQIEDAMLQATALIGLGAVHRREKRYWNAISSLDRALESIRSTGDRRLELQLHEAYSITFEELGDSDKALQHYKLYSQIKEELLGEEKRRVIAEIEVRVALEKAEREREIYRLQAERLRSEVEHKSRELTAMALSIVQKNEMIDALKQSIAQEVSEKTEGGAGEVLNSVIEKIDSVRNIDDDWKMFEEQLNQFHPNFVRNLSERHTDLTPTELRICALLRSNLATKDISNLLYLSERTVENHRYRIRKKLGLPVDINLSLYLAGL